MDKKNLPPLPDACMITYEFPDGAYDSESMAAYGRACYEAALADQPAASAEPSDGELARLWRQVSGRETLLPDSVAMTFARALLSRYGRPAGDAQPVAWLRKNGFRFDASIEPQDDSEIPLYTAPVAAQKADGAREWQPIETAPHDQEVLLGWTEWDGAWKAEVGMASWGWRTARVNNISLHGRATHWQTLPPAPPSSARGNDA